MREAVYLPLLLPLLAVPLLTGFARSWHPRLATWLLTVVAAVLALASTSSLVLLVVVGATQVPVVEHAHRASASVMRAHRAVHPAFDSMAAVLLPTLLAYALAVAGQRLNDLLHAHREASMQRKDSELVVLDSRHPVAYALPGRPGRIVVSAGMLGTLDPAERRALLAHERAHLAGRHHRFLVVTDVAVSLNPVLRPIRTAVRFTVERWADEVAAVGVGDRRLAASAVGKAALAARGTRLHSGVLMAAATGPVPRRVAALLAEHRTRTVLVWVTVLLALASAVTVSAASFSAAKDLQTIFDLASSGG